LGRSFIRRWSLRRFAWFIEAPDIPMRVAAAKLLHLIDPETLAGINMPDETE
jgi:hypothetical protein